MTRGHRTVSNTNTTSSSATATSSSSNNNSFQQQQTPRRGNKTLGWYLGDKLNGGGTNATNGDDSGGGRAGTAEDSSSTSNNQMAPQSRIALLQQQQRRRGSLVEAATTPNSSRPMIKLAEDFHQNGIKMGKRHLQQPKQLIANANNHRPRANSSAISVGTKKAVATATTTAQTNDHSENSSNFENDLTKQAAAANQCAQQQRIGKGPTNAKEDYWYYDEVSDGFYYEHNGTRGWRKRRSEWGTVEQMKGMTGTEHCSKRTTPEQQQLLLTQHYHQQQLMQKQKAFDAKTTATSSVAVPSLLAPQQLNKYAAQQLPHERLLSPTPSTIFKYYDPATDGFYYEMASFDGWKRRQPQAGTADGTSPPQGPLSSSSYCSPLLAGNGDGDQQTKMTTEQQQQAPHRKIQPLHYQAYQQPAPQLNSMELQEMIMLAQQNHLRASAAVPSCCCSQLRCCPSSTSGTGSATCCCTIAAMMAQLVLKQQQQNKLAEYHQNNNMVDNTSILCSNGLSADPNKLSSTTDIRSLLDMDTKPSLLDNNHIMDGLNQPKVSRPTVVRPTQHQHQLNNCNNNQGVTGLNLQRSKWDHHQLGGIVPSPPPPSLQARNIERPSSNLITAIGTNNNTTTTLSTGSFEEPYEFYWSGDEAGSEVAPLNTANDGKQQQNQPKMMHSNENGQSVVVPPFTLSTTTTTAASVSSIEDDDMDGCGVMDDLMTEMTGNASEKQRKIAPIGSEANQFGNGSKKRPDTLKLNCPKPMTTNSCDVVNGAYESISPGEILCSGGIVGGQQLANNGGGKECLVESPAVSYLPYQFNVDKFIADVLMPPSSLHQQQSLLYNPNTTSKNNNSLLVTPTAQYQQPPVRADSPLFTPIVTSAIGDSGVKDPWHVNCYGKNTEVGSVSSAHRLQQQLMSSTNPWAYP